MVESKEPIFKIETLKTDFIKQKRSIGEFGEANIQKIKDACDKSFTLQDTIDNISKIWEDDDYNAHFFLIVKRDDFNYDGTLQFKGYWEYSLLEEYLLIWAFVW